MRALSRVLLLSLVLAPCGGMAQFGGPHTMVDDEGNLDMEACATCHDDSMQLSLPKDETCTLCHAEAIHAGSREHLRAKAADVARLVPKAGKDAVALPLTDDGRMYCGSCHLFHDPAVAGEKPLAMGWIPSLSGFPLAVRDALTLKYESLAKERNVEPPLATFVDSGTRALRLPVSDGSLCRHCHGGLTK